MTETKEKEAIETEVKEKESKEKERYWIVLEDDEALRIVNVQMIEVIFKINALPFITGDSIIQWLSLVKTNRWEKPLPELALLDIRVPGMLQGHEVARLLRQTPGLENIAIVLGTGYAMNPKDQQAIIEEAQPDLFLRKPYPPFTEFQKILEEIISRKKQP